MGLYDIFVVPTNHYPTPAVPPIQLVDVNVLVVHTSASLPGGTGLPAIFRSHISSPNNETGALGSNQLNVNQYPVPPDATTVRVLVRNSSRGGVGTLPATDAVGCGVAVGTLVALGNAWDGAGTKIVNSPVTLPASDGMVSFGPYTLGVIGSGAQVAKDANGNIGVAVFGPAGIACAYEPSMPYGYGNNAATSVSDLNTLPGVVPVDGSAEVLLFEVVLEFDQTAQPRLVLWSDSIFRGAFAGAQNAFNRLCYPVGVGVGRGWAVDVAGVTGILAAQFAGETTGGLSQLKDISTVDGAVVLIELGFNDIGGASTPAIVGYISYLVARARAMRASEVWVSTVSPSSTFSAGNNNIRNNINAVVRSQMGGSDKIFDLDLIVRDPSNHNQLLPAFAQADQVHLTTAAYTTLLPLLPTIP